MRKKGRVALAMGLALVMVWAMALAAEVFRFEKKSVEIFEGESIQVALLREGQSEGEGTLTYSSSNPNTVAVAADGTVTGLKKGQGTVKATLKGAKRSWSTSMTVTVARRVTQVTLNTTRLSVYRPTDDAVAGLMREGTEYDVIVVPAGKSVELKSTVTPSDANSRKVSYTSSDEGILKIGNGSARGMQAGECDLTVASVQNPEIRQIFHVLVTQPVTKMSITAPEGRTVNAGESMQLYAALEPASASIRAVTWSSRNPSVAVVDENGLVTGLKKGTATIEARAADGSGKTATLPVTVAQKVTAVTFREDQLLLPAGQMGYLHATVLPNEANEKGLRWSTSDPGVATVSQSGQVTAIRRGECTIYATSKSNPSVSAAAPVRVIQRVTAINFLGKVSLPINTTAQLSWQVEPSDADVQEVIFTSSNRNVATVDANGLVYGLSRGSSVITAMATDGSNKRGQIRVTVTQPVEGVSIQYGVYHVQLDGSLNAKAIISPRNANNQNVEFYMSDESIASVRSSKNIGRMYGRSEGNTTLTAVTEDGGFTATAEVRVADFNRAVVIDDLYIEGEQIRIVLRNRSNFTVNRVYFTVETFDGDGQPLVCNSDGYSNSFEGSYRLELGPDERSEHYRFHFGDYVQPMSPIGAVTIRVTGWRDTEDYTRNISEEHQPTQSYRRFIPKTTDQ